VGKPVKIVRPTEWTAVKVISDWSARSSWENWIKVEWDFKYNGVTKNGIIIEIKRAETI
jgi:hypothetical protein